MSERKVIGAWVVVFLLACQQSTALPTLTPLAPILATPNTAVDVLLQKPGNLQAELLADGNVQLSWDDNSDNETGFVINRDGNLLDITAANAGIFLDKTPSPNTIHTYSIHATSTTGDSIRVSTQITVGEIEKSVALAPTQNITNTRTPSPTERPQAQFEMDFVEGVSPFVVTLNAGMSSDPDGTITKYKWQFGDGIRGEGVVVSHTFQSAGNFPIRLDVTDDDGFYDTMTQWLTVTTATESSQILVDYFEDSGFERGIANVEDYYEISHSERSISDPIEGDASLHIVFPEWSSVVLPVVYPWREGPSGSSLTASGTFRINAATEGTTIQLCAVVYYSGVEGDEGSGDERHEQCEEAGVNLEGIIELSPTLTLDPIRQLNRAYFWLSFNHIGAADITLDDAHLILDIVER